MRVIVSNNLEIINMGLNFKPNENFVLKFNYQVREKKSTVNINQNQILLNLELDLIFEIL